MHICVCIYVWYMPVLGNSSFLYIDGTDRLKSSAESFKK